MAICGDVINGRYVDLKSVDVSDAEFTMNIRNEPEFIRYLPQINNTIEQQREWINRQREKEGDYFWVMFDKEGNRFGTLGVYDVNTSQPKGRSLAAKGNALQNIEAVYLIYKYVLEELNAKAIYGWTYETNLRAIRFNSLFGGIIGEPKSLDGIMIREVVFKNPEFKEAEKKLKKMLYRH